MDGFGAALARLTDSALVRWVREDFGVELVSVTPATDGLDTQAAVWRGVGTDGSVFAVKWSRRGIVPGLLASAWLADGRVPGIAAPLPASSGRPCSVRDGAALALIRWVDGDSGLRGGMDAERWRAFGVLMARLHAAEPTGELRAGLPHEDFQPVAVGKARAVGARIDGARSSTAGAGDSVTRAMADLWLGAAGTIAALTGHAETLGARLRADRSGHAGHDRSVISHGDAHIANLVVAGDGRVWLIDWDDVALGPRERDLMFVVGGVIPVTDEQRSWFFEGYGPVEVDPVRLAYYRCSRALDDLAESAGGALDEGRAAPARVDDLAGFGHQLSPTGSAIRALSSLPDLGIQL